MAIQEFDFASGKVLDPKRKQAILALENAADSQVVQDKLRENRYQFLGAESDIRAALELVRKHKVGLLFLDADLAGVNVNELLPSIKKAFAGFSVIVLSARATREMLSESLRLGAAGLLVKPVQAEALDKVMAKIK